MFLSIPLAMLLFAALPGEEPAANAPATAIAPFLGDEVAAVVHIDLKKWGASTFFRRVLGPLADEDDLSSGFKAIDSSVAALKTAGAGEVFLLFDPAHVPPALPTAVVPLAEGADGKAIAAVLSGSMPRNPFRWPSAETIRGAVVADAPDGLASMRTAVPKARPDLAAAFAGGAGAAIQIAVVPSRTLRRSIEESMTALPALLGGGPITTLTQGLSWISLSLALEPKPAFRAVVQGKDPDAAKALLMLLEDSIQLLANASRNDPALAAAATSASQLKPLAQGDRITLDFDPEKTAELVALPIRRSRESARRTQCSNNIKQILLAMHNYHTDHNTFPPAYSKSADGKPLLSWRVHVLPYLEQQALYDEFHKDEPWDSAHNKPLISRIPAVYTCPSGSRAILREGKTAYLTPRGPATIFPGATGVKIQEIADGTSNTIAVVDAGDAAAVVWTKPDDWDITGGLKLQSLFGHHPAGTNIGLADGSSHFVKEKIRVRHLHDLTTRNGGEIIDWNSPDR
jgi:hypothetical protein